MLLLAVWSVLWLFYLAYFTIRTPGSDEGTRDIMIWVIGLVAIVAFRGWLYRGRAR